PVTSRRIPEWFQRQRRLASQLLSRMHRPRGRTEEIVLEETMLNRRAALAATLGLSLSASFATIAIAQAPAGKVTVVTSFSKDVTDPIKKAFEKAVPGVTLEVQNRNTNAGVKYVEETKANNQVDLFWASAPDAFE